MIDYRKEFDNASLKAREGALKAFWDDRKEAASTDILRHSIGFSVPSNYHLLTSQELNDLRLSYSIGTSALLEQLKILDTLIRDSSKSYRQLNVECKKLVEDIDAELEEALIQLGQDYSEVVVENFASSNRRSFDYEMKDPKTNKPFSVLSKCHVEEFLGLTLPLKNRWKLPMKNVKVNYDYTDVGDSRLPLLSNDVLNLARDCPFKWHVIRRAKRVDGLLYSFDDTQLAIDVDFGSYCVFNLIDIETACPEGLILSQLVYKNHSNEKIVLDLDIDVTLKEKVFLDMIGTSMVTIVFKSNNRSNYGTFSLNSYSDQLLNDVMFEKFGVGLNLDDEEIPGYVYDMSIKALTFYFVDFEGTGYWIGEERNTPKLIGADLSLISTNLAIDGENYPYYSLEWTPETSSFLEAYLLVKHKKGVDLVPIPHTEEISEKLIFTDLESKITFMPDFKVKDIKRNITGVLYLSDYVIVEFEEDHGFVGTYSDRISIYTSVNPNYNATSIFWGYLTDSTIIMKRDDGISFVGILDGDDESYMYFLRHSDYDCFSVWKEATELTLGVDYQISIDGGTTWSDEMPTANAYEKRLKEAGQFALKFYDLDFTAIYSFNYTYDANQMLHPNMRYHLKHNEFLFSYPSEVISVAPMLILRNSYYQNTISSIVNSVTLKLRDKDV